MRLMFHVVFYLVGIFLLCLITPTYSQNYALKQAAIQPNWLVDYGIAPTSTAYQSFYDLQPPPFQMNMFGREYSMAVGIGGSLHFGSATQLSIRQCCREDCITYCDLTETGFVPPPTSTTLVTDPVPVMEAQLAVFPLQLDQLPTGTRFKYQSFSNSTTYVLRTVMETTDYSIGYAVILLAPSTVIIGLEQPTGTMPTDFFDHVFSGFIGAQQSVFAPSPINNDETADVQFPSPKVYPSTRLISYARSQYAFGRSTIYCSLGGQLCSPSYLPSLSVPQFIPVTTNSDNACWRPHNSGFLNSLLLQTYNSAQDNIPGPRMVCFVSFYDQNKAHMAGADTNVPAQYDQTRDIFQCLIDAASGIDLSAHSFMVLRLAMAESVTPPSQTQPYQPIPVWTPVNYQQDFTVTTPLVLTDSTSLNTDSTAQYIPLSITPPEDFPWNPTTTPSQCHCKFIRYRSNPSANPNTLRPYEYGLAFDQQRKLRPFDIPVTYNTTITEKFYTNTDFCYTDCTSTFSVDDIHAYNNCGQCMSFASNPDSTATDPTLDQKLNCWGMCDTLNARRGGYYSYLMHYPIEARENGLIIPNSPFHDLDIRDISPTVMDELPCATAVTQNDAGEPVGFTTYRSHLSTTLEPIQWFKVASLIITIAGLAFAVYLMITLARARTKKEQRKQEKYRRRADAMRRSAADSAAAGGDDGDDDGLRSEGSDGGDDPNQPRSPVSAGEGDSGDDENINRPVRQTTNSGVNNATPIDDDEDYNNTTTQRRRPTRQPQQGATLQAADQGDDTTTTNTTTTTTNNGNSSGHVLGTTDSSNRPQGLAGQHPLSRRNTRPVRSPPSENR